MINSVLGIDIGGTNIKIAFVDKNYSILRSETKKTSFFPSFEDFAFFIKDLILSLKNQFNVIGIGIGAPNANFYTCKIENAPNLNWGKSIDVCNIMEKITGIKTKLTSDANAIALAELKLGYGKKYTNFLVITIGTGLGSGIVVNGEIFNGAHGWAGELGHINIIPDGRQCSCGSRGCLETYVSDRGITQTYIELGGKPISAFHIANLAYQGDKKALTAYKKTGYYLALGLKNYIHLFDNQAVIFFGGIANSLNLFKDAMIETLNEILLPNFRNKQQFLYSKIHKKYGAAIGAATLIF